MSDLSRAALNLGICRIVFYLWALVALAGLPLEQMTQVPGEVFTPNVLSNILNIDALAVRYIAPSFLIWKISTAMAGIGLLFPLSAAVSFFSGFFIFSLFNGYSCGFHGANLIVISSGILALSRSGDVLSVDTQLRHHLFRENGTRAIYHPFEYIWPRTLIRVCWVLMFLGAGLSKLHNSGASYFLDHRFLYSINLAHLWSAPPASDSAFFKDFLNSHLALANISGICVVILELCAPLALLSKRGAWLIVVALGIMQILIYEVMHITSFIAMPAIYTFWVPWDAIYESAQQALRKGRKAAYCARRLL